LFSPTVSVQWLADYLGAENLVILDAGVLALPGIAKAGYLDGHIPGAVFADVPGIFSDPSSDLGSDLGLLRPRLELFEAAAASVGVLPHSTVIVYDNADSQLAAHLWWLFRSFGFDQVAVLDGGLAKWRFEDRTVETGDVEPEPGMLIAIERPGLWADRDECEKVANGAADGILVAASAHAKIVDPKTHTFVSHRALIREFGPALASPASRLIVNDEGIGAATSALALTLAGHADIAILESRG
jgi:thiosulfate/3-mercaptopyruvate sulfurtransferase